MHKSNYIPSTNSHIRHDEGQIKQLYRTLFRNDKEVSLVAIKYAMIELGIPITQSQKIAESGVSFEDWKSQCEEWVANNQT